MEKQTDTGKRQAAKRAAAPRRAALRRPSGAVAEEAASYASDAAPTTLSEMVESLRQMRESLRQMREMFREERQAEKEREAKRAEEEAKRAEEFRRAMERSAKAREEASKEAREQIREIRALHTSQWGKFVESLIDGCLVRLLVERGIDVNDTSTRVRGCRNGKNYEFDIIAHDDDTIVVVEVKTTLKPDDVDHFLGVLAHFREYQPNYRDKRVLAAVGYIVEECEAAVYAYRKGLFVIRATGDSASIINDAKFRPKEF